MSNTVRCDVHIDDSALRQKLDALIDNKTMLEVHNIFAKMCDPYVPMDEGVLSQSVEITPEYVRYTMPYAHYQYTGVVYGPNIPIFENGQLVGFFSIPGMKKHPTGRDIVYSADKHPLATREWDKAMMRDNRDSFTEQIKEVLRRRAREIYG